MYYVSTGKREGAAHLLLPTQEELLLGRKMKPDMTAPIRRRAPPQSKTREQRNRSSRKHIPSTKQKPVKKLSRDRRGEDENSHFCFRWIGINQEPWQLGRRREERLEAWSFLSLPSLLPCSFCLPLSNCAPCLLSVCSYWRW